MKQLKVDAIKDGTVIDHIPPGKAFQIIEYLNLRTDDPITIGTQLPSKKLGKKDIIKVENREFSPDEYDIITLLAPDSTFVIIRDYNAVSKVTAKIPDTIRGLIACPNPVCICNHEKMISRFSLENRNPVEMRCDYCEHLYSLNDITRSLNKIR